MSNKKYLIDLEGQLQERFEEEVAKGFMTYTGLMRYALNNLFEQLDEERELKTKNKK